MYCIGQTNGIHIGITVDVIFENTLSLNELLICGTARHHMLLTPSQLIVSRLTLINSSAVKMSIHWLRSHQEEDTETKACVYFMLWHDTNYIAGNAGYRQEPRAIWSRSRNIFFNLHKNERVLIVA